MGVDDRDRQSMDEGLHRVVLASDFLAIDMWGAFHSATSVMSRGVEMTIGQCAHPHQGDTEVEMNSVERETEARIAFMVVGAADQDHHMVNSLDDTGARVLDVESSTRMLVYQCHDETRETYLMFN